MDELRFLEIMGKIDVDLLKEADVDIEKRYSAKPTVSKRGIYAVSTVAAAAVITVCSAAIYNARGNNLSAESEGNSTAQNTNSSTPDNKGGIALENCYIDPFSATVDPDSDAYSEDEVHQINIRTADGLYRQLEPEKYDANGISSNISVTDFGGYIGKIVEVNDSDYHGNGAESKEPTLAGADVYYYSGAGKNKAFIIVKKGDRCSMFIDDTIDVSDGFQKGLAFFNVQSADDIQAIEYRIDVPDGNGRMITSVQKTITDTETIREFYELMCQLRPEDYSKLPVHIGTPKWLNDARESYKADPNAPAREDYGIAITLKDGTVLQEITYQPYLGNGYVDNMQELTPEQNTVLKKLLG